MRQSFSKTSAACRESPCCAANTTLQWVVANCAEPGSLDGSLCVLFKAHSLARLGFRRTIYVAPVNPPTHRDSWQDCTGRSLGPDVPIARKVPPVPSTTDQKSGIIMKPTAEQQRLAAANANTEPWRRFGLYLSERQWGTVRED